MLHILQQCAAVLRRKLGVIQYGGGGADDGGQGGADIVGHGAEQVSPHFDLFVFHPQPVQLAGLGGQSGGDDRNTEKGQEGQGVAGDGQVEGPIGKGEEKVDGDDAQHRREKTQK